MRLSGRQEGAAGGAPQGRRGMKGADDAQQSARASARGRKVDFSRWAPLLVFGGIWSRCSAPRCTSDAAETRRGTRTPLTSDCCCSRVARLHVLARSAASLSPRRRPPQVGIEFARTFLSLKWPLPQTDLWVLRWGRIAAGPARP